MTVTKIFFKIFIYCQYLSSFGDIHKINWTNAYIRIRKETKEYTFGTLRYIMERKRKYYFSYVRYDIQAINKICKNLKFDDFQSFSMRHRNPSKRKNIRFISERKILEYL